MARRTLGLYAAIVAFLFVVGLWQGTANLTLILCQSAAYALIALGLNIQFGFGGLFNFAILGLLAVGGFTTVFISYPVNAPFWSSDGPMLLGRALGVLIAGGVLVWLARRIGMRDPWHSVLVGLCWFVAYVAYRSQIDPAADYIEHTSGWVGGLGLNPLLGWALGGVLAGIVAYFVGRVALGLRTDYLAIATIGIGEIIRTFIKNMDWLTRGTLTVSPIPWPVPLPQDLQAVGVPIGTSFVYSRLAFLGVAVVIVLAVIVLIARAYAGPWGRMMRAIRDNHIAAGSMGKNVTRRQLEVFVLGSIPMGIGGAMLTTFAQIFDPSSYQSVNHNFMPWVMVIVGGTGNSLGVILGVLLIYVIWIVSDPASQFVLLNLSALFQHIGWGAIPEIDSRSVQMRVFVLGIVIWLALRFAPRGLLPEIIRRDR
ncbi:MAG: branched-chain amino acid ABC transporter permease [Devosia sp.]